MPREDVWEDCSGSSVQRAGCHLALCVQDITYGESPIVVNIVSKRVVSAEWLKLPPYKDDTKGRLVQCLPFFFISGYYLRLYW